MAINADALEAIADNLFGLDLPPEDEVNREGHIRETVRSIFYFSTSKHFLSLARLKFVQILIRMALAFIDLIDERFPVRVRDEELKRVLGNVSYNIKEYPGGIENQVSAAFRDRNSAIRLQDIKSVMEDIIRCADDEEEMEDTLGREILRIFARIVWAPRRS